MRLTSLLVLVGSATLLLELGANSLQELIEARLAWGWGATQAPMVIVKGHVVVWRVLARELLFVMRRSWLVADQWPRWLGGGFGAPWMMLVPGLGRGSQRIERMERKQCGIGREGRAKKRDARALDCFSCHNRDSLELRAKFRTTDVVTAPAVHVFM